MINLPNFPAKSARKVTQKQREKLPPQSFQQKKKLFSDSFFGDIEGGFGNDADHFLSICCSFPLWVRKASEKILFSKTWSLNASPGNEELSFDNLADVFLPQFQEQFTQNKKTLRKV